MNRLPPETLPSQTGTAPAAIPSTRTTGALAGVCLLALLLAACGGSSDTAVSTSPITQTGGTLPTSPVTPGTGTAPPPTGTYNLGGTPQAVIDLCMSNADKEMLTQVNDARAVARTCGTVNYPAAAALSWHCTLENVAYAHSRDMGDNNFFSHTGSDGLSVADRVTNAGYNWSAVGENIAAGQPTVSTVMTSWLGSAGHCANIMRSTYTELGAASYTVSGSDYPIYWTQVFAHPR